MLVAAAKYMYMCMYMASPVFKSSRINDSVGAISRKELHCLTLTLN